MTLALPERPAPAPAPAPVSAAVQYMPAPAGSPDGTPRVFAAIADVMRDITPVSKNQTNQAQKYKFRGIDDLMSAMAGPMRAHGLFILPEMLHRAAARDGKMTSVVLTMRYHIYGPAGDCLVATVPGEASDFADKATNKAQSAALKYLLLQVFMIPVDGKSIDDGDRDHPEPPAEHRAERQQQQNRKQQRQQQPRRSQRAEAGPWEQPTDQQAPPAPQPSRDYLAEATPAPAPVEQAPRPSRDYVAEAQAAKTADVVREIYRAAAADGYGPGTATMMQIADIGRAKAEAASAVPTVSTAGSGTTAAAATGRATESRRPDPVEVGPAPYSLSDAVGAAGAMDGAFTDPAAEAAYDGPRNGGMPQPEQAAAEAENLLRIAASRANLPEIDNAFQRVYGLPIEQATAQQLDEFRARVEAAAGGAQ